MEILTAGSCKVSSVLAYFSPELEALSPICLVMSRSMSQYMTPDTFFMKFTGLFLKILSKELLEKDSIHLLYNTMAITTTIHIHIHVKTSKTCTQKRQPRFFNM